MLSHCGGSAGLDTGRGRGRGRVSRAPVPSLSPRQVKTCFSCVLDAPGCRTQSAVLYKELLGHSGVNSVLLSSALKQEARALSSENFLPLVCWLLLFMFDFEVSVTYGRAFADVSHKGQLKCKKGFPGRSVVGNPPAKQKTWVRSLGWEDPLEEEMATHSGILAGNIPWTEEPGGLQPTGSQRVGRD